MLELVLFALTLAIAAIWWWRARRGNQRRMPREIRRGTLVYAEKLFRAPGPVVLVAKVDRAYRVAGNQLVLVELKTRRVNRPYRSDVIELSAQRVAIMRETGAKVLTRAYVVVGIQGDSRTAHKVELLSEAVVDALIARRQSILAGRIEPHRACAPRLCSQCSFQKICVES